MNQSDNLLFGAIKLPDLDCEQALNQIEAISKDYLFYDNYRNTMMIPLMTKNGETGKSGSSNRTKLKNFEWTTYAPPVIAEWFENSVFPVIKMRARIMIIITEPGGENFEHIDCDKQVFGSRQHKFRYVLQGKTNSLYFITKTGNLFVPDIPGPFIMDGSWPHGMINDFAKPKITLALGAPWTGLENYENLVRPLLNKQDYTLPDNYEKFFQT